MPEVLTGRRAAAHLLRRAGFGPDAASLDELAALSYDDAVDQLLAGLDSGVPDEPANFDPYLPGTIQQVWLERMVRGDALLAEKLAFFWHGHFATSNAKIQDPLLMWQQYRLFRGQGGGAFKDLVLAVSRDVAMIRWLDGNSNRAGHANENYGRELQELFTLGIGNYTEHDIREVARAFTGWGSRHHEFVFREHFHDGGEKTIHGQTGAFGGEDVVAILTTLPACGRFVCGKLLRFFSHPDPTDEEVEALAVVFRDSGGNLKTTLAALFRSDRFRSEATERVLVKSPVEFSVGALRALGVATVEPKVHGALDRMGQILFRPPSVKGWTSGTGWLSSGAVVERLRLAQTLARSPRPDEDTDVADIAFQDAIPEPLAALLEKSSGPDRVTAVLGCPEFQLA